MRIERVDDRTVKCFLSNEELDEYDLDYKDFVLRSNKAAEVLQEIVKKASEQVGYKPPKYLFELQIMVLPDQGMLLTLKEGNAEPPKVKEFMDFLGGLRSIFEQMGDPSELEELGDLAEQLQDFLPDGLQQPAEPQTPEAPAEAPKIPTEHPSQAIFAFESLNRLMTYAAGLPSNLRVDSRLYKMAGIYFLYLARGGASYERYSKACVQALEFSQLCGADETHLKALEEHGTCLIAEKALRKLRA